MQVADPEHESSRLNAATAQHKSGWRRLPTAWIHLLWVECFPIYVAVISWVRLMNNVNTRCAMGGFFQENSGKLERYFGDLFFFGHSSGISVRLHNVTDDFFLADAEKDWSSIVFTGMELTLPATRIWGANVPWLLLAWLLPFGAGLLMIFIVVNFATQCIWSFESAAYLCFTWRINRTRHYKWLVGVMVAAPIILPLLWLGQIWWFNLTAQLAIFQGNTFSGLALLLSLNHLANPTDPTHRWQDNADFFGITFRRSFWHLPLFGRNATFGMKIVDALWTAEHGDKDRLRRYVDGDDATVDSVMWICQRASRQEATTKARRAAETRQAAASAEAATTAGQEPNGSGINGGEGVRLPSRPASRAGGASANCWQRIVSGCL